MTQSQALSVMKTGRNVFLTGEPGSGKTHTANEYVAYARAQGIETAVTASTGIAATHMGGMTIHSWSGIGVKEKLDTQDLDIIAKSKYIAPRVRRARVLIIEEISMLSGATLSLVDAVCRRIKQNPQPFGGLQVVFVGDFFQLPPVMKREEPRSPQLTLLKEAPIARFAYDAQGWKQASPIVCYLTEQHRQDDTNFLTLLSAIRRNVFDNSHLRTLQTRKIEYTDAPKGVPKLFSHNADVDRVNDEVLAKLSGDSRAYTMTTHGPSALVSTIQRGCLSPMELRLKVGASVMFTKNNQKEGFVNGTLGIVERFDRESGYPIIRTRGGKIISAQPMDWALEEHDETRAKITQVPLRLAWAITVHKSQGMSLDEAVVDLKGVFEFGQGYVALSRVRRLSGLHLLGWNARAFQVHPEVLAQDVLFRSQSESTLLTLADYQSPEAPNKLHRYEKIREKHPRAYKSWDEEQDSELRELYLGGSSIGDLAKTFSRTKGSIRSRLTKFNLLEMDAVY